MILIRFFIREEMNKTSKQKQEYMNKCFHKNQRKVLKKISKSVEWNGQEFESISKLAKHLRLDSTSNLYRCFKEKKPFKGHLVNKL